MSPPSIWQSVRERLDALPSDAVFVTPADEHPFVVDEHTEEWIAIQFRDGGDRTLPREQFRRFADQIDDDGVEIDGLPPGIGPYVSVLSVAPAFDVVGGRLQRTEAGAAASLTDPAGASEASDPADAVESPYLRSEWDVRSPPQQVHDDAVLVADVLEEYDVTGLEASDLPAEALTDCYVLLSDVQRGADDLRKDVRDALLERLGPDGRMYGRFGSVTRVHSEHRRPKDDEAILDALDEVGIPHEWVTGVDREKLDVVLATTELEEEAVYDYTDSYYVRKTGTDAEEKRSRLQGLKDRLAETDAEGTEELREEIESLEDRIEDVLAA